MSRILNIHLYSLYTLEPFLSLRTFIYDEGWARKSTSTIYSNTRLHIRRIDQAAAKLAMGISKFWNKKYTYLRQAGFVNYKLEKNKNYYIADFNLHRLIIHMHFYTFNANWRFKQQVWIPNTSCFYSSIMNGLNNMCKS